MKNATAAGKALQSLLKKIGTPELRELPATDDPVEALILSFLLWESTTEKALAAYEKVIDSVVDHNDLRVCMPHEIVEIIGERYPKAHERAQRLRATLRDVYLREHVVSLESLAEMGKRDLRKYVDTLDGIPPYVAARLLLVCYDTHAIPVDDKLIGGLAAAGVVDDEDDLADVSSWLAKTVKNGLEVHGRLQHWSDTAAPKGKKKTSKAAAAKKTTRKAAPKKTAKPAAGKTAKKTAKKTAASSRATKKTTPKAAASSAGRRKSTKKKTARSSAAG